jgi:GH15 family glucan-1,4-alpha-glucosidase
MPQPRIDHYGLIGNMRTAALVSPGGSIDWLCLPVFDSPSVFASILDEERGGSFAIAPDDRDAICRSFYYPDTNVLVTRFVHGKNEGELVDLMPVSHSIHDWPMPEILRIVRVEHGSMKFRASFDPRFDYGRGKHGVEIRDGRASFDGGEFRLALDSSVPMKADGTGVSAHFALGAGERAVFALWHDAGGRAIKEKPIRDGEADHLLYDTIHFWKDWVAQCTYNGRWRRDVVRSALALKLLTYSKTGAVIAAPTTSLPEHIGGKRNWDYRYVWLRDAAFTIYALLRIGFRKEAAGFMDFLQKRCHELEDGRMLPPMFGIDGRHSMPEECLDHFSGYHGSRPVRIGNKAYEQLQLDIVGTLMDAVYLYNKHAAPITHDLWVELARLLDWTCKNWQKEDSGIWEVRHDPSHFTYSKLLCWVALDRGLRLAASRGFPGNAAVWRKHRDEIYERIMQEGYNQEVAAFTQAFGSRNLDAANLLMPLVYFISPHDPRMASTLKATNRPRGGESGGLVSDFLVYRYDHERTDDGLNEPEGTFTICTFWFAEALSRAGRMDPHMLDQARLVFERTLEMAGPLGLFSEQIREDGLALGNYPQGLTHLSLITAALHLDRVLDGNH